MVLILANFRSVCGLTKGGFFCYILGTIYYIVCVSLMLEKEPTDIFNHEDIIVPETEPELTGLEGFESFDTVLEAPETELDPVQYQRFRSLLESKVMDEQLWLQLVNTQKETQRLAKIALDLPSMMTMWEKHFDAWKRIIVVPDVEQFRGNVHELSVAQSLSLTPEIAATSITPEIVEMFMQPVIIKRKIRANEYIAQLEESKTQIVAILEQWQQLTEWLDRQLHYFLERCKPMHQYNQVLQSELLEEMIKALSSFQAKWDQWQIDYTNKEGQLYLPF